MVTYRVRSIESHISIANSVTPALTGYASSLPLRIHTDKDTVVSYVHQLCPTYIYHVTGAQGNEHWAFSTTILIKVFCVDL